MCPQDSALGGFSELPLPHGELLPGGGTSQVNASPVQESSRSQTSSSLSFSFSSTFFGWPLLSRGYRSAFPKGWGEAGSRQWQRLPSGVGSLWEKEDSFKMRWHRIFLSQTGREGVGSFRNLLAGEGAIGGSPAHSLLPDCSEGKVPSGIWWRARSWVEIAIHFSMP